ncbi:MAG: serine/threonine protein kinase [Myxococcales bacterium]|nr:serine/threonine protein kinase [Myxococcales bacterium]
MSTQTNLRVGQLIDDRYRVDSILGVGGMGTVFHGVHLKLNRPVAIKMIHAAMANDQNRERFYREAQAMVSFSHPGVVTVFDYGSHEGQLFLVMEFLEGRSLREVLKADAPLALSRTVELMRQFCDALDSAHRAGLVHRDLKPDNLVISVDNQGRERLKIIDFGLAIERGSTDDLNDGGQILGTPRYMSPEQVRNLPLDARSDIYAVGAIFYELLCGTPPFFGDSEFDIVLKHVEEIPEKPSARRPDLRIPAELEALALWMLAKDPASRPATMGLVLQQLEAANRALHPDQRKESLKGVARSERLGEVATAPAADPTLVTPRASAADDARLPVYLVASESAANALASLLTPHDFELHGPASVATLLPVLVAPNSAVVVVDLREEGAALLDQLVPVLRGGAFNGNPVLLIGSAHDVAMTNRAVELGVAGFVPESAMVASLPKLLRRTMKRLAKLTS